MNAVEKMAGGAAVQLKLEVHAQNCNEHWRQFLRECASCKGWHADRVTESCKGRDECKPETALELPRHGGKGGADLEGTEA